MICESQWSSIFENKAKDLKDSWRLEMDENITPKYPSRGWKMTARSTCAKFNCSRCGRVWASNKAMVVFHMNLHYGKGTVKAKPLRQQCKTCEDGPMEEPTVNSGNVAILMENVVEQIRIKCYDEHIPKKARHFRSFDNKSPHEPAHCEACKQGICPQNKKRW